MKFTQFAFAGVAAVFLSACGGGGEGSAGAPGVTPAPPVAVPPPYTLTPATFEATAVAGYSTTINLSARQTVAFVGIAYMKIVPDADVIDPVIAITPQAGGTFDVQAKTSASVKAGHYAGNFTISVCADPNCTSQLPGAPFKLPYSIDVIPPEGAMIAYDQRALSPLVGAPEWETFQGNAQHTGYVPATLNAAAFTARWKWLAPSVAGQQIPASTLVTGGGRFYIANSSIFGLAGDALTAYKENDGSKVWSHSFDDLAYPSVNPPAFSNGRVFIAAGSQGATSMFAFDAATGAQLFKSQMFSQWERYLAPTVFDGHVFSEGGTYGGMYSFVAATGGKNFFTLLPQYDDWTPAVDANNLYTYLAGQLQVIDPLTGALRYQIAGPTPGGNGYNNGSAPIIGAGGIVFAGNSSYGPNAIVAFDTLAKTVRWTAAGNFYGNPGYADGLLFTANGATSKLEVLKEADGTLAWSWAAPSGDQKFASDVLVTKNLVFVSTDSTTYAIDRTSHATIWSYKAGGKLALSPSGILYIKGDTTIVAINL